MLLRQSTRAKRPAAVRFLPRKAVLDVLAGIDATSSSRNCCVISGVQYQVADEISVARSSRPKASKCPRCWNYRELGGNEQPSLMCVSVAATLLTRSVSKSPLNKRGRLIINRLGKEREREARTGARKRTA